MRAARGLSSAGRCAWWRFMEIKPLGDAALLVELGDGPGDAICARAVALARALEADRMPGVHDIVPAFAAVGVYYDPLGVGALAGELPSRKVWEWLEAHARKVAGARARVAGKTVVVPVAYGGEHGPDLEVVAKNAGLAADDVVKLHTKADYRVAAVGFAPGFPYLLGLPEKLHTPRRSTPRTKVAAGSVGIGGAQTGVYPQMSPGGWQIIGRTALRLFDPAAERPALLAPGDRVRFKAVNKLPEPTGERVRAASSSTSKRGAWIEVVRPGLLTTVQDLGRRGWQALGVSPGGAMDALSARVANALVGNGDGASVLELSGTGPELEFGADTIVAIAGAEVSGVPFGRPFAVKAGEVVDCSRLKNGARAYLAVAGGLRVPTVLGGAGTALKAGFGGLEGRALKTGDRVRLGLGEAAVTGAGWRAGMTPLGGGNGRRVEVRFVEGVQAEWFSEDAHRRLTSEAYHVTTRADRMGMRLSGPELALERPGEMISQPVATGSIQVPPDGQPIVLMADRQTIGGYPQIGNVISVDLPKLAQLRAGAEVRFAPVSHAEAQRLWMEQARDLAWLRTGLMCRR